MRPNEMNVSTTPILATKTLPNLSLLPPTQKPSVPRAPRIDVEPLYTSIKSAISDAGWTMYKTSLSSLLLGNLNQEELSHRLDKILVTRDLENAHNKLVLGIYGNLWRDAPEAGVASWVSSGDKVGGGTAGGKAKGDEGEKRLKGEVMGLSRRERKRLKAVHVGGPFDVGVNDGIGSVMQEYHEARRVKLPEAGPATATGGYQKTSAFAPTLWLLTQLLMKSRLGPRDPQTLHLLPLHRNS
jgi:transcriptional coactivator HFI1/ADA1